MNSNKIGTTFIVTIFVLTGIGVSYAGLTDYITVYGTITTATVDLEIEEYSGTWVWKIYPHDVYITNDPGETFPPDVGELVAYAKGRDIVATDPVGYDAVIEFDNLFPCIDFMADIVFHYAGTIPARITDLEYKWFSDMIDTDGDERPDTEFIDILMQMGVDSGGQFGLTYGFYKFNVQTGEFDIPVGLGSQLHYCDLIKLVVTIHLPQDNRFQGLAGIGYVRINVLQWNDECNGQTTEDKVVNLPEFPVTLRVYNPYPYNWPSYFLSEISGIGPEGTGDVDGPYNVWDGNWLGWCVNLSNPIYEDVYYTVYLYSSYDPNMPDECKDPDWPYVNWIINNKGGADLVQIQMAIWYFIDGGYSGNDPVILGLIDGALNNPEGINYVPNVGEWVAVICWIDADHQISFIEVDP